MKKKILKASAAVIAIILLAFLGFFANAFLGNPVSKHLATQTAEKHIEEKYADTDFEIEKVSYDFKDSCYHAFIKSPSSIDSHFSLAINMSGKLIYDSYEDRVTSKWNTSDRISTAYREKVDEVLNSPAFPYNASIGFGDIEFDSPEIANDPSIPDYAINTDELVTDADYDLNEFGAKAGRLTIYIEDENVSHERLTQITLDIRRIFDEADVKFRAVNLVLEYPKSEDGTRVDKRVEVMDFPYSDIYEEDMLERVKASDEAANAYYAEQDAIKFSEEETAVN